MRLEGACAWAAGCILQQAGTGPAAHSHQSQVLRGYLAKQMLLKLSLTHPTSPLTLPTPIHTQACPCWTTC